jgi:hypothetical protein
MYIVGNAHCCCCLALVKNAAIRLECSGFCACPLVPLVHVEGHIVVKCVRFPWGVRSGEELIWCEL